MANLRAIRTRIKSVENTRKITKSMKMVSAAKLRHTQAAYAALRDFADQSEKILAEVSASVRGGEYPLLAPRDGGKTVCYVLIVGNRGLCGTYNSALLRYLQELAAQDGRDAFLVTCGRWGRDLLPGAGIPIRRSFEQLSDTPNAAEAAGLAAYLRQLYLDGEADEIILVYQQYKSVLQQLPGARTLLPLAAPDGASAEGRFLFEPDRDSLINTVADLYLNNTVHAALLEARIGEHSARMTAMTAAADNTEELIGELTLQLNHARQAAITTEIAEIAGGAEALKNK